MQQARIERFDFFSLRDFSVSVEAVVGKNTLAELEEEVPPPNPADAPPPPSFSLAQLEAEKKKAFDEGHQKGLTEGTHAAESANAERETALVDALKALDEQLQSGEAYYKALLEQQSRELTTLAIEIARHVAGKALAQHPEGPVEQLVRECLPLLLHEPNITLTLHPDTAAMMEETLDRLSSEVRYEGEMRIETNTEMGASDCRLRWQHGEAGIDLAQLWESIYARLHVDVPSAPVPTPPSAMEPAGDFSSVQVSMESMENDIAAVESILQASQEAGMATDLPPSPETMPQVPDKDNPND